MKKKIELVFACWAIVAISVLCASFLGCDTTQQASYKTLSAVAHTVDTAMKAYADARVAGKVDDATHAKVVEIKKQYETAFLAAATVAQVNLASPPPTNLVSVATQLLGVINSATKK